MSPNGAAEPFDAVLLDAPCSATGTIRRHPDIPWLKREKDIATLAALQRRLLPRAVELLAARRLARLLHLFARARGRHRRRCAICSPRSPRGAPADRQRRSRRRGRVADAGGRPAHAAVSLAGCRFAHGRARRLLCRRLSSDMKRFTVSWPRQPPFRYRAAGGTGRHARSGEATPLMSRVSVAERSRLSVFVLRGGVARKLRRSVATYLARPAGRSPTASPTGC